jgi:flagellar hook-length control protein FliK
VGGKEAAKAGQGKSSPAQGLFASFLSKAESGEPQGPKVAASGLKAKLKDLAAKSQALASKNAGPSFASPQASKAKSPQEAMGLESPDGLKGKAATSLVQKKLPLAGPAPKAEGADSHAGDGKVEGKKNDERSATSAADLAGLSQAKSSITPLPKTQPGSGQGEAGLTATMAPKPKAPAAEEGGPRVTVSDLRKAQSRKRDGKETETAVSAQPPDSPSSPRKGAELHLDLNLDRAGAVVSGEKRGAFDSEGGAAEVAQPQRDFSSVLADQLKETWNNDIVQSAHIVLRDGDSGTIRLRLHPDSLGGVKIELKLADNSISGKIIVESDEAKTAFERNMAQLQDAFKAGGFESSKLEVQVGGGNQGGQGQRGGAEDSARPFWSERRGIASLSAAVPDTGLSGYGAKSRAGLNILA